MKQKLLRLLIPLLVLLFGQRVMAQQSGILINLAALDGVDLTPDNILNYQVQLTQGKTINATVKGTIRYKTTGLSFGYSFPVMLRPGLNTMTGAHPQWTFSSSALRELFQDYKRLPEGTIEYCVEIAPSSTSGESLPDSKVEECLYEKVDDIFLINLVDPEDNAKLYEHNPILSWVVNYPFASALTYKLRVAEIKQGQNKENAIVRNNPVYSENNITTTSQNYPIYAKPLELYQPYVWTVDAYYKGLLLGGAAPWKFTIIDDSLYSSIPKETSFIDLKKESGKSFFYAVGDIKLKYVLEDEEQDSLTLKLFNPKGEEVQNFPTKQLAAKYGDNRYVIDLKNKINLKHFTLYTLIITDKRQKEFRLLLKYVNPDFL